MGWLHYEGPAIWAFFALGMSMVMIALACAVLYAILIEDRDRRHALDNSEQLVGAAWVTLLFGVVIFWVSITHL